MAGYQTNRIIAAANAGLEHREFAIAFLEIQAGHANMASKAPKRSPRRRRNIGDGGLDPRNEPCQIVIANGRAIDLKPFVETKQMRRGE